MSKRAVIEKEMRRIYEEKGQLVPEEVVEEARAEDAPLHPFFEWDVDEAARAYLVVQARELIRSVQIRVVTADQSFKVRAFQPMRKLGAEHAPPGYVPAEEVAADPVMREVLLRAMRRDIHALTARYGHLKPYWRYLEEEAAKRPGDVSDAG